MNLLEHSIQWCRGEILEGKIITVVGALLLASCFLFRFVGTTAHTKAMFLPFLVASLLLLGLGIGLIVQTGKYKEPFAIAHAEDPAAFAESEKARTEKFIANYMPTRLGAGVTLLAGFLLYTLLSGPTWKASGLALVFLAFAVLVIDHFSEERAREYQKHIYSVLK